MANTLQTGVCSLEIVETKNLNENSFRLPINEGRLSSFSIHYALDFVSVFIHFTIYSASSGFHMATACYVSAMVLDIKSILERCDVNFKRKDIQLTIRNANVQNALNKAIKIHMNVLE